MKSYLLGKNTNMAWNLHTYHATNSTPHGYMLISLVSYFPHTITLGLVMLILHSTKPYPPVLWLGEWTQWIPHTSAPPWCHQKASTGSTSPLKGKWLQDWTAIWQPVKLSSPNLCILHQVRQHHNHTTLSVVDHLPEVSTGGLHWCLGNNEPPPLLVALFSYAKMCTCIQYTVKLYLTLHFKLL